MPAPALVVGGSEVSIGEGWGLRGGDAAPTGGLRALLELRPRCEGIEGIRGEGAAPTGAGGMDCSAAVWKRGRFPFRSELQDKAR
jgi:hypothetical protein